MASRSEDPVPLALRRAQAELFRALAAETDVAEAAHRQRGEAFVREAVRSLSQDPDRDHDWSGLTVDF